MANDISYEAISAFSVKVRLGGKVVGFIKHLGEGWQYFPINQTHGGEIYPTLPACKNSLEG